MLIAEKLAILVFANSLKQSEVAFYDILYPIQCIISEVRHNKCSKKYVLCLQYIL